MWISFGQIIAGLLERQNLFLQNFPRKCAQFSFFYLSKLKNVMKRWTETQPGWTWMGHRPKQFCFDSKSWFLTKNSTVGNPCGLAGCSCGCWESLSNPGILNEQSLMTGDVLILRTNPNWTIPALEPHPILCLILFSVQDQTAHEALTVTWGSSRLDWKDKTEVKAKSSISHPLYSFILLHFLFPLFYEL